MNNGKNGAIVRFGRRTLTTLLLISASTIMLACSQETPGAGTAGSPTTFNQRGC